MQGGSDRATSSRVVILAGLPGSGKSTLAARLKSAGWVVVNQDQLGDRKRCENEVHRACSTGRDVVVDRCNADRDQRAVWVKIARTYGARTIGVQLHVALDDCIQRCKQRRGHPTLHPNMAEGVIKRFASTWVHLERNEGFGECFRVSSNSETEDMLAYLGVASYPVPRQQQGGPKAQQTDGHVQAAAQPQYPVEPHQQAPNMDNRQGDAWPAKQAAQFEHQPQPSPGLAGSHGHHDLGPGGTYQPWGLMQGQQATGSDMHQGGALGGGLSAALWWKQSQTSATPSATPGLQYQGPPNAMGYHNSREFAGEHPAASASIQYNAGGGSEQYDIGGGMGYYRERIHSPGGVPEPYQAAQRSGPHQPERRMGHAPPTVAQRHRARAEKWGAHSQVVPSRSNTQADTPLTYKAAKLQGSGKQMDTPIAHYGARSQFGEPLHARMLDEGRKDKRIILLFDLNGTLTSHTAMRRSTGESKIRPGIHHLRRLKATFELGIFSSASKKTVSTVIPMLEEAAGDGPRLFESQKLILHRVHTQPAPDSHTTAGGNAWDTCKPLRKWFKHLDRVLLVDDDAYKALPSETWNMVLVPCWDDTDGTDHFIGHLVDTLLAHFSGAGPRDDVRRLTASVTQALVAVAPSTVEQGAHGGGLLNHIVPLPAAMGNGRQLEDPKASRFEEVDGQSIRNTGPLPWHGAASSNGGGDAPRGEGEAAAQADGERCDKGFPSTTASSGMSSATHGDPTLTWPGVYESWSLPPPRSSDGQHPMRPMNTIDAGPGLTWGDGPSASGAFPGGPLWTAQLPQLPVRGGIGSKRRKKGLRARTRKRQQQAVVKKNGEAPPAAAEGAVAKPSTKGASKAKKRKMRLRKKAAGQPT